MLHLLAEGHNVRNMAVDVFAMAPAVPRPVCSLQGPNVDIQIAHSELECCELLNLHGRHATGACGDATGQCDVILQVV